MRVGSCLMVLCFQPYWNKIVGFNTDLKISAGGFRAFPAINSQWVQHSQNCLCRLYCVSTLCQLLWPTFKWEWLCFYVLFFLNFRFFHSVAAFTSPNTSIWAARLFNLDVLTHSCDRSSWGISESQFTMLIPSTHIFHIPADGPDSGFKSLPCVMLCLFESLFFPHFWEHLIRIQKGWRRAEYKSRDKNEDYEDEIHFHHLCATHKYVWHIGDGNGPFIKYHRLFHCCYTFFQKYLTVNEAEAFI